MPSLLKLALAALAATVCSASTLHEYVEGIGNMVITISKENTLNATTPSRLVRGVYDRKSLVARTGNPNLLMQFLTSAFAGPTTANGYITGMDPNGNVVFLQANGQWYTVKASANQKQTQVDPKPITLPFNNKKDGTGVDNITLPTYISSGRFYYVLNNTLNFLYSGDGAGRAQLVQPSIANPNDDSYNKYWGFVEFTNDDVSGLTVNPTYVDFAGVPAWIGIYSKDNKFQNTPGLPPNGIVSVCDKLKQQQNNDGQPWGQLCRYTPSGQLVRVISPYQLRTGAFNNNGAFGGYYDNYINTVFNTYTKSNPLYTTHSAGGNTACYNNGKNQLQCDGDSVPFAKPTVDDIFSCSTGSFANAGTTLHKENARALCAAFTRSTLLVNGGNTQPGPPASSYYTVTPTHYYSKFVHNVTGFGLAYAFAYDDVNPAGSADQSGKLSEPNPKNIIFDVGGLGNY